MTEREDETSFNSQLPHTDESSRAIADFVLRMDLATHPGLVREHLGNMNEADHQRFLQLNAIAYAVSEGDMAKKDAIIQGAVIHDLMQHRERTYSLDSDIAAVIPLPQQTHETHQRERRFKLFRRRNASAGAAVGAAILTFSLFRRGNRFNGDDAA